MKFLLEKGEELLGGEQELWVSEVPWPCSAFMQAELPLFFHAEMLPALSARADRSEMNDFSSAMMDAFPRHIVA